jgi:hypothetical protein
MPAEKTITIFVQNDAHKRILYGAEIISRALEECGFSVRRLPFPENRGQYCGEGEEKIYIGQYGDRAVTWLLEQELLIFHSDLPEADESFGIETCPGRLTVIAGGGPTGALYGALELAGRIKSAGFIEREIAFYDAPLFKLRGPAIGLQLTKIEPPRLTYEYPITPGRFPWFYDKELWIEFLDMMLEERCNILYIWSGHPFSSLVIVPDYPYALEVTEEEFRLNKELFFWLTAECDRRGIWVVLKFYNIHIPLPFAEHNNIPLLQSSIDPLVADYTYKSIVEFIKSYPNIGLMVCLGEALRGTQNKTKWFVETIIPAVKEGLRQAGIKDEPPLILRGHDCDPVEAMNQALPLYGSLYTMWKYNGEGLTTYYPRGEWRKRHLKLASLGSTHILNIHILADLEPFRFMAPLFIQKCVQAGRRRLGGNAIHVYPLFYWDWPYSPDKTEPRLLQIRRDRLWFDIWMRYAWNPNRNETDERVFWINRFARQYAVSTECAEALFEAMECSGQCAPKILGRIGITEGNRQTMSLGMTMSQLVNVTKYSPNYQLWYSVARKGEQSEEFIRNKIDGKPHAGETPPDMIRDVMYFACRAKEYAEKAKRLLNGNSEAARLCTDVEAIYEMSLSYCKKLEAALLILEYRCTMNADCSGNYSLLEKAVEPWEESLDAYRRLTALTKKTYRYANSMQTPQRKIPFPDGGIYGHWEDCLGEYEKEYENFKKRLAEIKAGILPRRNGGGGEIHRYDEAPFTLLSEGCEAYTIASGEKIFTDTNHSIKEAAPELAGLRGIRFSFAGAINGTAEIKIEFKEDSRLLVGYVKQQKKTVEWLSAPELETNTHADEQGGLNPVLTSAIRVSGCPQLNIHAPRYPKGIYTLSLGTGGFILAGVIRECELTPRDAGLEGESLDTLEWLFE